MGGDATFSGTNYQASVIAYVFVHVLTESKLRWLSIADDTPVAVSGGLSSKYSVPIGANVFLMSATDYSPLK